MRADAVRCCLASFSFAPEPRFVRNPWPRSMQELASPDSAAKIAGFGSASGCNEVRDTYNQSISLYLFLITKSQQLFGLPERLQLASKSLFFSRVQRTHDVLLGHYRAVRINRNFRRAWRRFSRLADAELNPTVSARRAFPYPALRLR